MEGLEAAFSTWPKSKDKGLAKWIRRAAVIWEANQSGRLQRVKVSSECKAHSVALRENDESWRETKWVWLEETKERKIQIPVVIHINTETL